MKWVFQAILLAMIVASLPAVASADIFQWTDNAGVTHYTNLKAEVPADDQASLQVVVDEAARQQQTAGDAAVQEAPASAGPVAPVPDPPSQAQLMQAIYDRSQWLSAYLEGLQRGLDVRGTVAAGGAVEINGPLVVSGSSTVPDFYGYGWPYSYGYGWPYFYPGVAVFHHERARHLGRLHEGPFVFGRVRSFGHSPPHARARW